MSSQIDSTPIQISAQCLTLTFQGKKLGLIKDVRDNTDCTAKEIEGEPDATQTSGALDIKIRDKQKSSGATSNKCLDKIIELIVDGQYVSVQGNLYRRTGHHSLKNMV